MSYMYVPAPSPLRQQLTLLIFTHLPPLVEASRKAPAARRGTRDTGILPRESSLCTRQTREIKSWAEAPAGARQSTRDVAPVSSRRKAGCFPERVRPRRCWARACSESPGGKREYTRGWSGMVGRLRILELGKKCQHSGRRLVSVATSPFSRTIGCNCLLAGLECLFVFPFVWLSLTLLLSHALTLSLCHALTLSLSLSLTLSLSAFIFILSLSLFFFSLSLSLSLRFSLLFALALSLSLSLCFLSLSLFLSLWLSLPSSLSLSLSLSLALSA